MHVYLHFLTLYVITIHIFILHLCLFLTPRIARKAIGLIRVADRASAQCCDCEKKQKGEFLPVLNEATHREDIWKCEIRALNIPKPGTRLKRGSSLTSLGISPWKVLLKRSSVSDNWYRNDEVQRRFCPRSLSIPWTEQSGIGR